MDARARVACRITSDPIDPVAVLASCGGPSDGAVLLFLGTVRDHADGRPVTGLTYEAYAAMAEPVLEELAAEVAAETGVGAVRAVHRVGELDVGEVAVAVAVASPHRQAAYEASRALMERLKARLPVWKHEHYADGEDAWVEGADPRDAATGAP